MSEGMLHSCKEGIQKDSRASKEKVSSIDFIWLILSLSGLFPVTTSTTTRDARITQEKATTATIRY